MQDDFKIEDAKPEDVETLRSIVRDAWVEIYPNEKYGITAEDIYSIDWYDPAGLAKRRKEITESKDIHTWVLRNDLNQIGGFCKVAKHNNYGELMAMYVVPELKGKGLGKKLMQQAFEWFGLGLDIRLKVVAYNTRAIEFYKKMGFAETENKILYEETQLPNGKEIPRIEMIRQA
jgi:ribosomal protein S18 acetylase RimI-like enzyme